MDGSLLLLEVERPKQFINWSWERRSLVKSSLGPRGKEYWYENTEGRSQDFQGRGTEECGRWGAKQWSRNNVGPFGALGLVSSPALQADLSALARLPTLEVNDLIFPKMVFLLV